MKKILVLATAVTIAMSSAAFAQATGAGTLAKVPATPVATKTPRFAAVEQSDRKSRTPLTPARI